MKTTEHRLQANGIDFAYLRVEPSAAAASTSPGHGRVALLLHGFPESRHSWREALPELARAGYRAVAPDQRGYSPGARPDPGDLSNYSFDKLGQDAVDLADAAGAMGMFNEGGDNGYYAHLSKADPALAQRLANKTYWNVVIH